MEKIWSKAEIAHLKRNANSQSAEELAHRFHTDAESVRQKLEELGLGSSDASANTVEAATQSFGKAMEFLHAQDYQQAAELLEEIVGSSEDMHLTDRARQFLEICQARIAEDTEAIDPYLKAVFEKNNGNLEQALELCQQQETNDDERYAYLMASIQALAGADEEAIGFLETAIRLEPRNRVHAYHDPDFEPIRGREEFTQLVQANASE